MPFTCRFYEQKFPEVDDVIMVNVRQVAEMGAYVNLLEYNNIEGMILLSELSRRRIRSINKLIRIGRSECVIVLRVDKDKGYIDLSKRRVSPEDIQSCEDKFAKAKCVNGILRQVAEHLQYSSNGQLEELYTKTAWMFDKKYGKPGAAYEAFKLAVSNPSILDECEIDDKTKSELLIIIQRRLTPQATKLRADIEVACYGYEGIDAVKAALKEGLNMYTEDFPLKINLIAPPLYVMAVQTMEAKEGSKKLDEAMSLIEEAIKKYPGGEFSVKHASRAVTETDEAELAKHLERLESANKEISGDDDSEEDGPDDGNDQEEEA